MTGRAIVIGAGIVGACCAYSLLRRGFDVTMIEKDEPGRAASFGNSGSIGLASVPPLGMPGMLRTAPKMLLDPKHALVVRWRHLNRSLPWLARFARALDPARVDAIAAARAALLSHAGTAYEGLLDEIGRPELIYPSGLLHVFETEAGYRSAQAGMALRRRYGIEVHDLSGDEIREMEPALSGRVLRGVHFPAVRTVTESLALTRAIMGAVQAGGGRLLHEAVRGFERNEAGVAAVLTDAGRHEADLVVLAAGAWSRTLARQLGDPVQLIAERGYHVMMREPPTPLRVPIISGELNVSIVTMATGLRMTTLAEFTEVDAPPDHDRPLGAFQAAAGLIRDLDFTPETRWMGSRPSTPDSLPVIGRSPHARNVIYAFGHGHLGLTFGAVTGTLVGQLARGEAPNIDISPYRPDRAFDGSHVLRAA